jgi:hypothetical protein
VKRQERLIVQCEWRQGREFQKGQKGNTQHNFCVRADVRAWFVFQVVMVEDSNQRLAELEEALRRSEEKVGCCMDVVGAGQMRFGMGHSRLVH